MFTLLGCAISRKAHLQSIIALSSTQAEYMAITVVVKEDIWLKELFGELEYSLQVTMVFFDKQSVIFLSKGQMFHDQTKYINIPFHLVRSIIEKGDCMLEKIHTNYNHMDMFTKSLHIANFKQPLNMIGVSDRN